MAEVFKRDKKAVQLSQLYSEIVRDKERATPAEVNVWKDRLVRLWASFEELHEAVIDRSGSTELNEQQSYYDETDKIHNKTCLLLEEMQSINAVVATIDPERLEKLENRHKILIRRHSNVCNRITAAIEGMSLADIDVQRSDVDQLHTALREIAMERMLLNADDVNIVEMENASDERHGATLRVLSVAKSRLAPERAAVVGDVQGDGDKLKVPQLQITPFDGRFDRWEAFRESFTHGIHSRANMPAVQKLQFLKSVLRGEPEELIRNFGLTNDNYPTAWKLLNDRFNNKRELVVSHLRILTSFSTCRETADDLRHMANKTSSTLLALQNLGRPTAEWDDWVVFHVCEKLDPESRRMWEQQQGVGDALPKWDALDLFLQGRIRALSVAGIQPVSRGRDHVVKPTNKIRAHHTSTTQRTAKPQQQSDHESRPQYVCGLCSGSHLITFCEQFRRLSAPERRRIAAEKALCFICLVNGHHAAQCRSTRFCNTCTQKHNTLLHLHDAAGVGVGAGSDQVMVNTTCCTPAVKKMRARVLLATAIVHVRDVCGELQPLRALLDQGSEYSFVSVRAAAILRLPRNNEDTGLVGLMGETVGCSKQSMVMCVCDRFGAGFSMNVDAFIIPRVTGRLKNVSIEDTEEWAHLNGIDLADPDFDQSHPIDILLGSDEYGALLEPGLRQRDGLPTAQKTKLGWILSGKITRPSDTTDKTTILAHHVATIDDQLARFWEMEETSSSRRHTEEEERCETFFEETVTRDVNGRLHVCIPMKHDVIEFGESQRFAVQRQLQIERKFIAHPDFAVQYRQFMRQYEELGHMREVVGAVVDMTRSLPMLPQSRREYYIPHHAVMKEASTTTKLRVVFDASRRSTNGVSLNEQMMVGPRLQDDLTSIMMRWRKFRVAYCADIEKMYRQIMIDEPDADLQRIVWRATANENMKVYQLRTVTYGTASAPYLAVKSLQTLAHLERERYPDGANIALNHFYVDDVLGGADTAHECIASQAQLTAMLASGGLILRKWASNCEAVLSQVAPADRECQLPLNFKDGTSISTLGVQWNPATDEIGFKIETPSECETWTKRTFLSAASRLYDPLGWLAPCIIVVKMMFQSLWTLKLEWDDKLPADLARRWNEMRLALHQLTDVRIGRWIGTTRDCEVEIHGFCDASMDAFAAVVYVRVLVPAQQPQIFNLCSKTRVAPLKVISLPRLELCGADLLVKLIGDVMGAMQLSGDTRVFCWTDSTIVLAWLRGHPSRFKVYVANRTAEIQRKFPIQHWRHVVSADNPADCASRGISPQQLLRHQLWWSGPQWLRESQGAWPQQPTLHETVEELRASVHLATSSPDSEPTLIAKYSSWRRLVRVTACCLRFVNNCRKIRAERTVGVLEPAELIRAREVWVRAAQSSAYVDELRQLHGENAISKSSSLRSLNPVLSSTDQILRVGGRLKNSHILTAAARAPAIIPRHSALSALLIRDAHEQTMHGGPQLMLAYLRRAYWVVDGPNEVRRYVQKCTVCYRYTSRPGHQQMAALPAARVVPSRPFLHCAMDYSGAIMVRATRGRGHHATKAYVAVFVCLATKAVHIELAGDLTTNGFIAAYERFAARRGRCSDIYSDNATNFVGAAAVFLRSERQLFDDSVKTALATRGTQWHFSPPLSPHFNGLAESAIRSVKHHIRRVVGESTLTFEELTTVLTKIEACLNSRPLCAMSNDPDDFDVLTPGHFLIGEPIVTIPQKDVAQCKQTALTRWQLTHQMVQHFWKRWSSEYLHTLQQRRKWQSATDNICIGDMVLVIEDNLPPAKWSLGRVSDVHPGDDGNVRVVTIRTRGSTFKRAVVKVARLPVDDEPAAPTSRDESSIVPAI